MMLKKTAKETESAFREELQALLKKYGATLEIVEERSHGYSEYCSTHMEVTVSSTYCEETHEYIQEYTCFELGSYLTPEEEG